jgi:DNA-binding helix-hairpin-helix protein with protein kinase domain
MNSMRLILEKAGTQIQLGQKLGGGGEGSVFAIEGRSEHVVKVYSIPPEAMKVNKLRAMAEVATPALLKIAAWPVDLVSDTSKRPQGFIMPRVSARRDIHELYGPKSRADAFPEADFRFLVHVATNVARALAVVHNEGHVVGDLNHGNILVGRDGTVMLIDCDSFQLRNGMHVYTCDVGVPLFTAPELHGRPFRGLERTVNHDLFGLAVLIFHLLFMGRHPFAGRYSGATDMPIERAIREYRFAYGPDRVRLGMQPPPGTIPLETMGREIASLFVSSFSRNGTDIGRPDAPTWVRALTQLEAELRSCSRATSHHFPRFLEGCPWCGVEQGTGIRLFGQQVLAPEPGGTVDLATLWRLITSVPGPGPDPPLPARDPPLPAGVRVRRATKLARRIVAIGIIAGGVASCRALGEGGLLLGFVLYGAAYIAWPRPSPQQVAEADREVAAARAAWEAALARWKRRASQEVFEAEVKELGKVRDELVDLPNERGRRLAKLEAERETRQRNRYLDRFHIARAQIRGIGPSRTAMLAAYGIETAADIDEAKILQIPGFGPTLTQELLKWRRAHERNFRFNPNDTDHHRDIEGVERDLESRRQALITRLRQGPSTLHRLTGEIRAARTRLMPGVEAAWVAFRIAEARRSSL